MSTTSRQLGLTLARGIALWTALIASMPRVGCTCADGTSLPYCVAATVSLVLAQREPKAACCDRCCRYCDDAKASAAQGTTCPVSGLPCRAVINPASPTTLVDVVDPPSPAVWDEALFVASDSQPKNEISWSPRIRRDHRPLSALLDLGQLLRV